MCGGGERRARKRAEKEAKRARRDAARREREAIARAEAQAKRMIEQQKKSYAAMQAMIPKAPPIPKARPASTTTETTTGIKTKKVENNNAYGGISTNRPKKRQRRGRSSLLIGLNPGVRGSGSGPNIK